jgi:hypothetical protein
LAELAIAATLNSSASPTIHQEDFEKSLAKWGNRVGGNPDNGH